MFEVSIEQDLNASNEEKNTPLHWACLNGHIEVIIMVTSDVGFVMHHIRFLNKYWDL